MDPILQVGNQAANTPQTNNSWDSLDAETQKAVGEMFKGFLQQIMAAAKEGS
jgi:hypothetical protein